MNGLAQVYEVNTDTRQLHQISHHPTPVRDYDFNGGDRLIYAAEAPVDWTERNRTGFAVGTDSLEDIAGKGAFELWTRIAFYIDDVAAVASRNGPRDVGEKSYKILVDSWGLWLSPRGTWAVALRHVDVPPASWWTDYVPVARMPYWRGVVDKGVRDYSGPHPAIFLQFTLINMATGASTPLLNAPCGLAFGGEGLSVVWSADERSVVLGNTFLPLDASDPKELAKRRRSPSIVEIDLKTRAVRRIADLLPESYPHKDVRGSFQGMSSGPDGRITLSESGPNGQILHRVFLRAADRWREIHILTAESSEGDLEVNIEQDVNTPPELVARDSRHRSQGVITDLNPQYRLKDVGHVETVEWKDSRDRVWVGGLLLPTRYRHGQRYPLVIQTHGYDPKQFLVDGPAGAESGFAARALANRDFIVLQVKDGIGPLGDREELDAQTAGYSAAIDKLYAEGLIDRDKVGIHGWSRTGFYVQHVLVFSKLKVAAASISDASELSAYSSVLFFGLFYPAMVESERMIGVPLWGDEGAQVWSQRDPTFHLDRMRAPLRIEANGQPYLGWDMYARLRRHHRPADFIFYPNGAHSLVRPAERFRSEQGTVNWYDFWLNGRENTETTDSEQYVRWRKLRDESNQKLE